MLKLASVFSDHMVVQREQKVCIWGTAEPQDKVEVSLDKQIKVAQSDDNGGWSLYLDPMQAGGPFDLSVKSSSGEIKIHDVMVGEVWLCSGQSNMQFAVKGCLEADDALNSGNQPQIRLYQLPLNLSRMPVDDLDVRWQLCSSDVLANFSAAGYFFGRHLHKELDVPVGLIVSAYGGSAAEAWMTEDSLRNDPELSSITDTWDQFISDYPADPEVRQAIAARNAQKEVEEGRVPPPWPLEPKGPEHHHRPGSIFNSMIHPLLPYTLRGVIWYQGEANAWRAYQYRKLLSALIEDWRKLWNNPQMWFFIVQLPGFDVDWLEKDIWPEMRESQAFVAETVPNSGIVCSIDVGDPNDLHPRKKLDVGERLARLALAKVYGKKIAYSGPVFRKMEISDDLIQIEFDYAETLTSEGSELLGFAVAGTDRIFRKAKAYIDGDKISIKCSDVENPVAVRYCWENSPDGNLFNENGLPAFPFRTDDWPLITEKRNAPDPFL